MKRRDFLKLPLAGLLPLSFRNAFTASYTNENIELIIVYNNLSSSKKLKDDWGYSAWIKTPTNNILFDTGKNGDILLSNLKSLQLNPREIDHVILSHVHHDHVGGLESLTPFLKETAKIYVPKDIYLELKNKYRTLNFIGVTKPVEVCNEVLTTGQQYGNGDIVEQAAIIKTDEGLILVHGCSHPGVDIFVKQVNRMFPDSPINLVTGGFHLRSFSKEDVGLLSKKLKGMNVKTIAPSHCTGTNAIKIIEEEWGNQFKQLYLGDKTVI